MRLLLSVLLCVWLWVGPAAADTQNSHGGTTPGAEMSSWFGDREQASVVDGCLPAVPTASQILPAFACKGYVHSGTQLIYVDQDARSVGPLNQGNGTYWLALHQDNRSQTTPPGWTRQAQTAYLWKKSATLPEAPPGTLIFNMVTLSGAPSIISAVFDRARPAVGWVESTVTGSRTDNPKTPNVFFVNSGYPVGVGLGPAPRVWHQFDVTTFGIPPDATSIDLGGIIIITHGTTPGDCDLRVAMRAAGDTLDPNNYVWQVIEPDTAGGQRAPAYATVPVRNGKFELYWDGQRDGVPLAMGVWPNDCSFGVNVAAERYSRTSLPGNASGGVTAPPVVYGGFLNVQDFGAVGNGVADDTAAFNAALAAVDTTRGSAVLVPSGVYCLSNNIRISRNKTMILGMGDSSILRTCQTWTNPVVTGPGTHAGMLSLVHSDLTNGPTGTTRLTDIVIQNLRFEGMASVDPAAPKCVTGLFADRVKIQGNSFKDIPYDCIMPSKAYSGGDWVVEGNDFQTVGISSLPQHQGGVAVQANVAGAVVASNTFDSVVTAVGVDSAGGNATITGNSIKFPTLAGIVLGGVVADTGAQTSTGGTDEIVVTGNTIKVQAVPTVIRRGIVVLENARNVNIASNTVRLFTATGGEELFGIALLGPYQGCRVGGNQILMDSGGGSLAANKKFIGLYGEGGAITHTLRCHWDANQTHLINNTGNLTYAGYQAIAGSGEILHLDVTNNYGVGFDPAQNQYGIRISKTTGFLVYSAIANVIAGGGRHEYNGVSYCNNTCGGIPVTSVSNGPSIVLEGLDFGPVTFATLGVPADGRQVYCADCNVGAANVCTSGGPGAFAMRLSGTWRCFNQNVAGGGGGPGLTVLEEGAALPTQPFLNFTGAGVTCVNNAGATRIDCTVPGGTGPPVSTGAYLNVQDFGAVGNGVADDTAAFNAAMAAVDPTRGSAVLVPSGVYCINNNIRISRNKTTLLGMGDSSILRTCQTWTTPVVTGPGTYAGVLSLVHSDLTNGPTGTTHLTDIVIQNLRFEGLTSANPAAPKCITGLFADRVKIQGNSFKDAPYDCIMPSKAYAGGDWVVEGNDFQTIGIAALAQNQAGVAVQADVSGAVVASNTFDSVVTAVGVDSVAGNATITGNSIKLPSLAGIVIGGVVASTGAQTSTGGTDEIVVTGNTIKVQAVAGVVRRGIVVLENARNVNIASNTLRLFTAAGGEELFGIAVLGPYQGCRVGGNQIVMDSGGGALTAGKKFIGLYGEGGALTHNLRCHWDANQTHLLNNTGNVTYAGYQAIAGTGDSFSLDVTSNYGVGFDASLNQYGIRISKTTGTLVYSAIANVIAGGGRHEYGGVSYCNNTCGGIPVTAVSNGPSIILEGVEYGPVPFAALGVPADGRQVYCPDCNAGAANVCTSGGTGALAMRLAGTWRCFNQNVAGGGGTGVTIMEEGTALPPQPFLNFLGTGMTCVNNPGGTRIDCTVATGGGALPDPGSNGLVVRNSGAPTTVSRILQGTPNQIQVTNGDGVAGNPVLAIPTNPTLPGTTTGTFSGTLLGNANTATALVSDPVACSPDRYVIDITAGGALSCAPVNLAAGVTNVLPVGSGGTGLNTATDDTVLVGNGAVWQAKLLPNCPDGTGNHLNYDLSTNTWVCGTTTSGAPLGTRYWVAQADGTLPNETDLGALTTGLLKHTVVGGVSTPATAVPGTDYVTPGTVVTDAQVPDLNTLSTGLTPSRCVETDGTGKLGVAAALCGTGGGSTGITGATNHGLMVATGGTTGTSLGVATNGQIPIGSTGVDPFLAVPSGTANQIRVTPGPGSLVFDFPPAGVTLPGTTTGTFSGPLTGSLTGGTGLPLSTGVTGVLGTINGGTGLTTAPDDTVLVGNGAVWQTKAIPSCPDSGSNHLNYDISTNTWLCGTSGSIDAPVGARYWVSQADAILTTETNLGALSDGLLKHTVVGGVSTPATAVPGTDYMTPATAVTDAQVPDLNLLSTGLTASRCVQTDGTGKLGVAAGVCGAGGGGVGIFGTPTTGQIAAWHDATSIEGVNTLSLSYAAVHVNTAGTIATGIEYVDTGAGGITRTLPAAVSGTVTRQFRIIKEAGAGALTIAPTGANTISGVSPVSTTVQWAGFECSETSATNWACTLVTSTINLATGVTGTLPAGNGGTGVTTATDDAVLVGNGTIWQAKVIPNCPDSGTNHLNYDFSTNTWICGTTGGAGGAPAGARYWVSQADATLTTETNLGALTDGLLKHTVVGGVSTPATAVAGTDYMTPATPVTDAQVPDLNLLSTGLTASRCVQTDGTGKLGVAAGVCGAGGGGVGIFGTPTTGQIAAWHDATSIEGVNTLSLSFAAAHVSTAGTIATGIEYVDTGAGGVTRTLPAAASGTVTRVFRIIKEAGAGTLTIAPTGANTISGPSPVTTTVQWAGFTCSETSATNWACTPVSPTIDFSTTALTAVDGELLVFNGTSGKQGRRATTTGMLKGVAGVLSAGVPGTDFTSPLGNEDLGQKRLAPRIQQLSAASGIVTAPDAGLAGADTYYRYNITGALTIPIPTGTPVPGQRLLFRLKPNTSVAPQTLTFTGGAGGYCGSAGYQLPTITGNDTTYVEYAFVYDANLTPSACWLFDGTTKATAPLSLADGGTGVGLADPGAHRLLGWDDTDNAVSFFTIGSGLTYTQATKTLSAAGGGGGVGTIQLWPGMLTMPDGTTNNLLVPAQVAQSTGTPPTDAPKLQFTDLVFDNATTDQMAFNCFNMPNDYNAAQPTTLYLNWRRTAGTTAQNVDWKAAVAAVTPGGTENLATKILNTVTYSGASAAGTTTNALRQSTITLNMDSAAGRDTVCVMFGRNADGAADTLVDPAAVSSIWLEYTKQ